MKTFTRVALGIMLLAVVFAAVELGQKHRSKFPKDVRVERNVAYLPEGRKERADLYFPLRMPKEKAIPVVLIIHGGGFVGGRRDAEREINFGTTLARNGYAAMSIDYVLANHGPVWPSNLWDCKTAVRWLRRHATQLNIDPDRIGVMGGSAGGHLAAMVALTMTEDGLDPAEPYGDVSCQVRCCVDFYGVADFTTFRPAPMFEKPFTETPKLYRRASPVTYVRSNSPPILLVHGTADTTVSLKQSELLAKTLSDAGVEHELAVVPGAIHGFDLQPPQRDLRPLVLEFLKRHL